MQTAYLLLLCILIKLNIIIFNVGVFFLVSFSFRGRIYGVFLD